MISDPKKGLVIITLLLTLMSVYFRISGQNSYNDQRCPSKKLLPSLRISKTESNWNTNTSAISTNLDSTLINDTIWRVMLHPECDCPMSALCEAYDGGYLLLGWFGSSFPTKCWLIKTDVNGNKLWERVFSGGNFAKATVGICQNNQGDIFITGGTYQYGDSDPYIVKLNACGEKLWCRVFRIADTYNDAVNVIPTTDGGCRLILNFASQDPIYQLERICQTYLDSNGNQIWAQYYDSPDTLLNNEYDTQLNNTIADSGALITGYCGYRDTTSNNLWYLKCYHIKTNYLGTMEWESVAQKDNTLPGKPGGQAWTTLINSRMDYYYSSTSHYVYPSNTSSPALLKMDLNGNVINVYDLVQGFNEGKLYQSAWITDSTLIGSAGWHNGSSGPQESKVVKFDTLGNILQTRTILASEYLCYVKKTIDGKFLFYTMRNNSGNPSIPFHNTYLFKLNGDLNFDSLNTQPKLYDSLCDQIAFQDTIIVNNCDITLTIDKTEQIIERSKLLLYPNPANQFLKIQLPDYICSTSKKGSIKLTSQNFKYKSNSYLRIYNITGIIIYQKKLSDSDQIIAIDLSEITQGTYFAAIYSQETNSETAKFIISR